LLRTCAWLYRSCSTTLLPRWIAGSAGARSGACCCQRKLPREMGHQSVTTRKCEHATRVLSVLPSSYRSPRPSSGVVLAGRPGRMRNFRRVQQACAPWPAVACGSPPKSEGRPPRRNPPKIEPGRRDCVNSALPRQRGRGPGHRALVMDSRIPALDLNRCRDLKLSVVVGPRFEPAGLVLV
jgi:hypothetical protein